MQIHVISRSRFVALLIALLLAACGSDAEDAAATQPSASAEESRNETSVEAIDACTFFDRDQLAEIIGHQLGDPEPDSAPPGFSSCEFSKPPLMYITETYPDPALPQSVNFSSITISTHPSSPDAFAEFRETLGGEGEDVSGIGDGAYFYGSNLLYVRVGDRGFSIRMYVEPQSLEDERRVRDVMVKLGRLGATKLAS